jgi:hypothetical protein
MSPFFLVAQKTFIPDYNFEQALINLDLDDIFDDSVFTSAIDTLQVLDISNKGITSLIGIEDFTQLRELFCYDNQIVELDLRYNSNLFEFNCRNNILTSLDIRNGNNLALWYFTSLNNDSLMCINVDDVAYANYAWEKDNHSTFTDNCNPTVYNQFTYSNSISKKVIKIVDIFGRETIANPNTPIFYIYDDGTVEKRITID